MTSEELKRIISLGEGQTTEFKRAPSSEFSREMVAFANSLGGVILIGVDDNGTIVGVEHPNRVKGQIQNTAKNLEPPLSIEIDIVDTVMVVSIPQSADRPHASSGRFYVHHHRSSNEQA